MTCVAEFTIPPERFPFGSTLVEHPEIRIEVDQIVPTHESALPFFWVHGADPETFMTHAEAERAVRDTRLLELVEDVALFRAEWRPDAALIQQLQSIDVTIVESVGTAEHWRFEVRTEDRTTFAEFQAAFEAEGIPISLDRLYDLDEALGAGTGPLTHKQREALLAAYRSGYFEAPREVTQQQLAEQFEVSRRALAERLRRGIRNLVGATLATEEDRHDRRIPDGRDP